MYKALLFPLLFVSMLCSGQNKKALDSVDKVIIDGYIKPQESAHDEEPDWQLLRRKIEYKYSQVQADRAITKAQIYYYYSKDLPKFCTALVHFTEAYEDKDDLPLMSKNATMVFQGTPDPKELAAAYGWMKHVVEKDSTNSRYNLVYRQLKAKVIAP